LIRSGLAPYSDAFDDGLALQRNPQQLQMIL
jgi:hypothetical protein